MGFGWEGGDDEVDARVEDYVLWDAGVVDVRVGGLEGRWGLGVSGVDCGYFVEGWS